MVRRTPKRASGSGDVSIICEVFPPPFLSVKGAGNGVCRRLSMGVNSMVPIPPSQPLVGACGLVEPAP